MNLSLHSPSRTQIMSWCVRQAMMIVGLINPGPALAMEEVNELQVPTQTSVQDAGQAVVGGLSCHGFPLVKQTRPMI